MMATTRFRVIAAPTHRLVAIAFAAYLLVVLVKLVVYHGDISGFIVAGDRHFSSAALTYPLSVQPHSAGYDGQFFYRLALDPLERRKTAFGISLDAHPVVRAQRILYPAMTWAVALGRGAAVPHALVVVNLLSLAALAWAAVRLAAYAKVPASLALLVPFYPGFVLSLARDTAEIPATALAFGAVLAATTRRPLVAGLLAIAAMLTRETTLFYLAGFGLAAVAEAAGRRRFDLRLVWFALPLLAFAAWQAVLWRVWGSLPFAALGQHDLSAVPLIDYGRAVDVYARRLAEPPFQYRFCFEFAACVAVAAFATVVVVAMRRTGIRSAPVAISWGLYAGMAMFFTDAIWNEAYGFLRILCDFYCLGIAMLILSGNVAMLRRLAVPVAILWLGAAYYVLYL